MSRQVSGEFLALHAHARGVDRTGDAHKRLSQPSQSASDSSVALPSGVASGHLGASPPDPSSSGELEGLTGTGTGLQSGVASGHLGVLLPDHSPLGQTERLAGCDTSGTRVTRPSSEAGHVSPLPTSRVQHADPGGSAASLPPPHSLSRERALASEGQEGVRRQALASPGQEGMFGHYSAVSASPAMTGAPVSDWGGWHRQMPVPTSSWSQSCPGPMAGPSGPSTASWPMWDPRSPHWPGQPGPLAPWQLSGHPPWPMPFQAGQGPVSGWPSGSQAYGLPPWAPSPDSCQAERRAPPTQGQGPDREHRSQPLPTSGRQEQAPPEQDSSPQAPGSRVTASSPAPHGDHSMGGETYSSASEGSVAMEEDEEEEGPPAALSFKEAIRHLSNIDPSLVESSRVVEQQLSAGERLLSGAAPQGPETLPILSPLISSTMESFAASLRGGQAAPADDASPAPELHGSMGVGKFFPPDRKALFTHRGPLLLRGSLPPGPLPLSASDRLLLPEPRSQASRAASLPDRVLAEWEESARLGLEAASLADTFMGGLVAALQDPSPAEEGQGTGFVLRSEPDPEAVRSFLWVVSRSLRAMTAGLSRAYFNAVLARRDAILLRSPVLPSEGTKAALRALPVAPGSLFGPQVPPTLKVGADRRRDDMALRAASAQPRPQGAPSQKRFTPPGGNHKRRRTSHPPKASAKHGKRHSRGNGGSKPKSSGAGHPQ